MLENLYRRKIAYAEIGIDQGNTTLEVCKKCKPNSEIHLFDFTEKVNNVKDKIEKQFGNKCKIFTYGVVKGDYNWDLMKLVSNNEKDKFDYVYLDGAHTLTIDGLAFVLIDKLLKVGGYIEFDDYEWTIGTSPTCSPYPPTNNKQYEEHFTKEQIDTSHVKLIVDNLVKTNNCYLEIKKNRIYQKIK